MGLKEYPSLFSMYNIYLKNAICLRELKKINKTGFFLHVYIFLPLRLHICKTYATQACTDFKFSCKNLKIVFFLNVAVSQDFMTATYRSSEVKVKLLILSHDFLFLFLTATGKLFLNLLYFLFSTFGEHLQVPRLLIKQ